MVSVSNNLNLAILNMAHNFINEGKIECLIEMGFTIEHLKQLKELSYSQITYIANSSVLLMQVNIDSELFGVILARAKEFQERNHIIDKAHSLGASIEILNKYFGLSTSDVSSSRKLKNLNISRGRFRKPDEHEKLVIWEQWKLKTNENPDIVVNDDLNRLLVYMDITQHVSMTSDDGIEPLTLTSVIKELEQFINL